MSTSALEAHKSGAAARGTATDLAETLARIEARLARIENTLSPVAALSEDAPKLVATFTDVLDEKIRAHRGH